MHPCDGSIKVSDLEVKPPNIFSKTRRSACTLVTDLCFRPIVFDDVISCMNFIII